LINSPIILALDTNDLDLAKEWIATTNELISIYKVGLEFYLKFGHQGIHELRNCGNFSLFLDLKLHDIPNTVAGAASSISDLSPRFLTVHASGGAEMISASVAVLPNVSITAVTVLTSLNNAALKSIGFSSSALETAIGLAQLSVAAGAKSIVCSPLEVAAIRACLPLEIDLITPGVRPDGVAKGDQSRTLTPAQAITSGANYLVIGRPITSQWQISPDAMRSATKAILESL
jgi:orotidine-5'-phosphate decarboxylase